MIPDSARSYSDQLQTLLESRGWKLSERENPFEHEWWAAEIWHFASEWSPVGARLFLTFVFNPMPGSRQEISLIRATPTRPNTWYGDDGETLHLKATRDGLSDFARKLDRFRNANA